LSKTEETVGEPSTARLAREGYEVGHGRDWEKATPSHDDRSGPGDPRRDAASRNGFQVLSDLRQGGFSKTGFNAYRPRRCGRQVLGLDAGADDYLVKPFAFAELVARVRPSCAAIRAREMVRELTTWR